MKSPKTCRPDQEFICFFSRIREFENYSIKQRIIANGQELDEEHLYVIRFIFHEIFEYIRHIYT